MARPLRVDAPGCWHHVLNRVARREPVFHLEKHCLLLLDCIDVACSLYGLEVHAWVFMPHHFHLLVRSVRGNLSEAMKLMMGRYTRKLNRLHKWDGPIFRGRFKSQLIEDVSYLRSVVPYIHLNPCRAGGALHPEGSPWSSAAAYADEATPQPFLVRKDVLDIFGSRDELLRITEALRTGHEPWDERLDLRTGFFIGFGERSEKEKQRFPGQAITVEEVIKAFEEITGIQWSESTQSAMGRRGNPSRRLAIWALRTYAGLSHKAIAETLGMQPGAVTEALSQLRKKKPILELASWMKSFREMSIKADV
jgi:putative transposase